MEPYLVVPLTRRKRARISVLDHRVLDYKWCCDPKGYAKNGPVGYMHRFLLGNPPTDVDHLDGNGLNNTRSNIHAPSRSVNKHRRHVILSPTGFYGVTKHLQAKRCWTANIKINYKRKYLGCFRSPEEAARAYDLAALEVHGEYAKTNFMWSKDRKEGWKQIL